MRVRKRHKHDYTGLKGMRILVTGASSGIGREVALRAGRSGAELLLVARREEKLTEVAEQIRADSGSARVLAKDLSEHSDCDQVVDTILASGPVDVLFANAGASIRRELVDTFDRPDDLERLIRVNYLGAARLILRLLPSMIERGRGQIINSSTGAVLAPIPRFGPYVASKAATAALLDVIATELSGSGIQITNLYFPFVATPMAISSKAHSRTMLMSVERAARTVLSCIEHPVTRRSFGLWPALLSRAIAPGLYAKYLNQIFCSYPSHVQPIPNSTRANRAIRRVWAKSPF